MRQSERETQRKGEERGREKDRTNYSTKRRQYNTKDSADNDNAS